MKLNHETRVLFSRWRAVCLRVAACVILLAVEGLPLRLQITVDALFILLWLSFCFAARGRIAGPLRTLANLLEALREGDYSIRARVDNPKEPLGEVMQQVNAMAATLRDQRLGALEARRCYAR